MALCFGWIDGRASALDDDYFLQRFTPRRARSRWSKINRDEGRGADRGGADAARRACARSSARRPTAAGTPPTTARRTMTVPDDLQRELDARPAARRRSSRGSTARTATRSSTGSRTRRSPRRAPAGSRSSSRCSRRGETIHPRAARSERAETVVLNAAVPRPTWRRRRPVAGRPWRRDGRPAEASVPDLANRPSTRVDAPLPLMPSVVAISVAGGAPWPPAARANYGRQSP